MPRISRCYSVPGPILVIGLTVTETAMLDVTRSCRVKPGDGDVESGRLWVLMKLTV